MASGGELGGRSASEFGISAGCHDEFGASDTSMLGRLDVAREAGMNAALRYGTKENTKRRKVED
jgi:hypothetical protein